MNAHERARDLQILERLRAAARGRSPGRGPDVAATEYDWARPHRFTPGQRARLEEFARRAARDIAKAVSSLTRTEVALAASPPAECYPAAARADDAKGYRVPLRDAAANPAGVLRLAAGPALRWVGQLLGGEGAAGAEPRDLSPLENALLLDLAAAMTRALSAASTGAGGPAIQHAEQVLPPDEPMPGPPDQDLWTLALRPQGDQDAGEITFVLRSELLGPIACAGEGATRAPTPAETREAVLHHLKQASVTVTACLGRVEVPVRDVVALESGDVLVLDTRHEEAVAITVEGQTVLRGSPVLCEGRYAVQVEDTRRHPRAKV